MKNTITSKEYELLDKNIIKDWKNGMRHSIPISLPSFNLMKYINVSPSFNYTERWYTNYVNKTYDPNYNEPSSGQPLHVVVDTVYSFRRNYEYSYSLSSSTNIYGMYVMKNPNSRVKAIRHKITPQIGFNYTPDFGQAKFHFWDSYFDGNNKEVFYTHFENGVYGYTGRGASGAINFSLNNNLEAKVLEKADSTSSKDQKPKYKKVKIIDNLSFASSYNLIADSFKLSPIAMNARTTIKGVSINTSAGLNPYMVDEKGRVHDEYVWNHKQGFAKLGRITNANLSFGMNFDSKKDKKKEEETKGNDRLKEKKEDVALGSKSTYMPFTVPWSFNFNYNLMYSNDYKPDSKGVNKGTVNQALNLGGRLSLTEKWQMDVNTNFDIQAMKFSFTTINISRNLHCWAMSFNFVPFGDRKSYSFNLSASSAMLRDLKIQKQSSWRDN
jgi:hypothetical protein